MLTFTPTTLSVSVTVIIFNDAIVEGNEAFFGLLDNQGQPVVTNPDAATVTIIEDSADSKFTMRVGINNVFLSTR